MQLPHAICRQIFEGSGLTGAKLQDEVYGQFPAGECELCAVTSTSSGLVENDEILTRLIIHPIHWDQGKIHPLAFNEATTRDLSVFREAKSNDQEIQLAIDEIKSTGARKTPPEVRQVEIIAQALTSKIREQRFPGTERRMCFVYDTATSLKPNHASVFTPSDARRGSLQRAVRRALYELFSEIKIETHDYRSLNF